jgi:hypothetical protein
MFLPAASDLLCFTIDALDPRFTKEGIAMITFAVIETDDGLTVVQVLPGQTPEDAAISEGGILADPGPYHTHEEALEALDQLEEDTREDRFA